MPTFFNLKLYLIVKAPDPVSVVFSIQMDRDMVSFSVCTKHPDLGSRLPQFVNLLYTYIRGDILVCLCTPTCAKPK